MLLGICGFHENWHSAFLMSINEIAFMCVPWNHMTFLFNLSLSTPFAVLLS
jgi:hypothetical protein